MITGLVGVFVLLWQLPAEEVRDLQRNLGLRSVSVRAAWSAVAEGGMPVVTSHLGELLRRGVLPVFSHAFIHAGVVAVVVNAFFLLAFGREVEGRSGVLALACLFVAGMLVGAAAHVLWSPESAVPAAGASAAVSAILGACLVRDARSSVLMAVPVVIVPVVLRLPVTAVVASWFVLQLEPLQQLLAIGVCRPLSWPSIFAGFAAGVVLSPVCLRRQRPVDKASRTTRTDKRPTKRPSSSKGK